MQKNFLLLVAALIMATMMSAPVEHDGPVPPPVPAPMTDGAAAEGEWGGTVTPLFLAAAAADADADAKGAAKAARRAAARQLVTRVFNRRGVAAATELGLAQLPEEVRKQLPAGWEKAFVADMAAEGFDELVAAMTDEVADSFTEEEIKQLLARTAGPAVQKRALRLFTAVGEEVGGRRGEIVEQRLLDAGRK